jgi:lipoic acid synthetase
MVGIGERDEEVLELMDEVIAKTRGAGEQGSRGAGKESSEASSPSSTDILTIGQYLQPTRNHLPMDRWVTPETFAMYKEEGLKRGFKVVESGPLVRSSYHAEAED